MTEAEDQPIKRAAVPGAPQSRPAAEDDPDDVLDRYKQIRRTRNDALGVVSMIVSNNLDHLSDDERADLSRLLKVNVNFLVQTTFEA